MKILIAGDWSHYIYEPACAEAMRRLGHSVDEFAWKEYYRSRIGRVERRFGLAGLCSLRVRRALERCIYEKKPRFVMLWRPRNIARLQAFNSKLVVYNNDSPFPSGSVGPQKWVRRFEWRNFLKLTRHADVNLVYRESDREQYARRKIGNTELLLPYYIDWLHTPSAQATEASNGVVFIGHYEPDGRAEVLAEIRRTGIRISLFGDSTWKQCKHPDLQDLTSSIRPVYGEEYVRALRASKVALSFLSKRNNDVYTRRSFEIPACGVAMLSEYSAELELLFPEAQSACYFSSPGTAAAQARRLMSDDSFRGRIALAGRLRVEGGHGIISRMQVLCQHVAAL